MEKKQESKKSQLKKLTKEETKKVLGGSESLTQMDGVDAGLTIRFCATTKRCTFCKKSRA